MSAGRGESNLSCAGMDEAECPGMEGLPRQELETVADELSVFGIYGTFPDFGAVIPFVVEQRMSDPVEMYPYLVCPAGLQPAFDNCHIAESFQYPVMCDGPLPPVPVGEYTEFHPV